MFKLSITTSLAPNGCNVFARRGKHLNAMVEEFHNVEPTVAIHYTVVSVIELPLSFAMGAKFHLKFASSVVFHHLKCTDYKDRSNVVHGQPISRRHREFANENTVGGEHLHFIVLQNIKIAARSKRNI